MDSPSQTYMKWPLIIKAQEFHGKHLYVCYIKYDHSTLAHKKEYGHLLITILKEIILPDYLSRLQLQLS